MSRKNWTDEKLFFRLQNNKSYKTYWDNVSELYSRANADIFNHCVKLIKSSNSKDRMIGFDVLAQLGSRPRPFYEESKQLFFEALKEEKNGLVLRSVLYAIYHNNDELKQDEIALLVSLKDSEDKDVRESLVFALLTVDNKLAIDALIQLSEDRIPSIRDWATFGIGSQIERDNQSIREALWRRVDDNHQDTKLEAIVGLASRKDQRVKEIIKREFLNGEFGSLLFEAIEELDAKEFLPLLKEKLQMAKESNGINPAWIKDLEECIHKLEIA